MTHPLITAALAMPNTHQVVTTYADGRVRTFATRSEQTAENHAVLDRRNIGHNLIDRSTGKTVRIVSVSVEPIPNEMVDAGFVHADGTVEETKAGWHPVPANLPTAWVIATETLDAIKSQKDGPVKKFQLIKAFGDDLTAHGFAAKEMSCAELEQQIASMLQGA